jgi:hypothetical protein
MVRLVGCRYSPFKSPHALKLHLWAKELAKSQSRCLMESGTASSFN